MIKTGDTVKMSDLLKIGMISNGSEEHVDEFGECEGIVEENSTGDPLWVDVRWHPSELRYGYHIDNLIKIEK